MLRGSRKKSEWNITNPIRQNEITCSLTSISSTWPTLSSARCALSTRSEFWRIERRLEIDSFCTISSAQDQCTTNKNLLLIRTSIKKRCSEEISVHISNALSTFSDNKLIGLFAKQYLLEVNMKELHRLMIGYISPIYRTSFLSAETTSLYCVRWAVRFFSDSSRRRFVSLSAFSVWRVR